MRVRVPALALVATLLACGVATAAHRSSGQSPARLLVAGKEYSLTLSRGSVEHGPALIQFVNRGEDPHDLRLRRIGRSPTRTVSAPEVKPGKLVQLDARLRAGRYRLWCSLPQHSERGMHAVLTVRGGP